MKPARKQIHPVVAVDLETAATAVADMATVVAVALTRNGNQHPKENEGAIRFFVFLFLNVYK